MTRVRTEYGVVEGVREDGLHVFRAVPYAAPPFGPRRFRPPQPPEEWTGVRAAAESGPAAPQPAEANPLAALYTPAVTGEDCLTLEIETPDPGAAGLPVLVHIHGGGYVFGAGSLPGYRGRTLAKAGTVHVAVNYRLGIDGFLFLGEGHDNLGLRDQAAALEWVRRNIRAFGGDPDRVTVFGQSGGAVSVLNQLSMPGSRGLFARAMAQSGSPGGSVDAAEAFRITTQVARGLRVPPTAEGLAGVPLDRTVAAALAAGARFARGLVLGDARSLLISPFRAVHGTATLPASAADAAASRTVPLLTGSTRNEMVDLVQAMIALAGRIPGVVGLVRRTVRRGTGLDDRLRAAYRDGPRRITDPTMLAEAVWTDFGFREPTLRYAAAADVPAWVYEFRWQPTTRPPLRGSSHGLDLPFWRDDLDLVPALAGAAGRDLLGPEPPAELAKTMHGALVRFAETGDPGWARYTVPERATMVFDTASEVVPDAAGVERQGWAGRPVAGGMIGG